MGKPRTRTAALIAMAIVAAACTGGHAQTATTAIGEPPTTTTTAPTTTTTTEPDPCPDRPFCVRYSIDPDAAWSDGRPVTADDFIHTFEAITGPVSGVSDTTGYDFIRDIEAVDDKTVFVGFSEVFPAWRGLFDVLVPAHFEGDLGEPGAPVTGPFALEEWVEGERIVLKRNPSYWAETDPVSGEPLGDVEELVFVFPDSARDQLSGLEGGDVDVLNLRPLDWMIGELDEMESVVYRLVPGPFWEHIDFNHDDPLLSQSWVREAIALAIDREAILDETVRLVDPAAEALDSAIWLRNSAHYRDNYDHTHDPEAAEALLEEHFCERGEDGIYDCQGRRMSFTWATTVGDEYRGRTFELAEESLAQVGIEIVLNARTPSSLFSSAIFFGGPGTWQMINFSWKGEADPYLANSTFYCHGDAPSGFGALNVNRYCNDEVESLIRSTERMIDGEGRIAAYNEADSIYLDDRAIVPLFQKPALLAWNDAISGPEPNISSATDLWNTSSWEGKQSVVVALGSEPDSLDPLRPDGDSARAILSAMFHGAYSINPSLEFREVLVAGAEALAGGG